MGLAIGPTRIRSQRWGGYISPADAVPHKARQGKRSSEQLNCTQFDQLILKKIVKIVATKCHILGLLNAPNLISAGVPPQTPLGRIYSAPQIP